MLGLTKDLTDRELINNTVKLMRKLKIKKLTGDAGWGIELR